MLVFKKDSVYLPGRLICAEDSGAVHFGYSITHKYLLPLEAGGSSGALALQVREDGHQIPRLHV